MLVGGWDDALVDDLGPGIICSIENLGCEGSEDQVIESLYTPLRVLWGFRFCLVMILMLTY